MISWHAWLRVYLVFSLMIYSSYFSHYLKSLRTVSKSSGYLWLQFDSLELLPIFVKLLLYEYWYRNLNIINIQFGFKLIFEIYDVKQSFFKPPPIYLFSFHVLSCVHCILSHIDLVGLHTRPQSAAWGTVAMSTLPDKHLDEKTVGKCFVEC